MKNEIFLIGVGNYTEVIIELAQDCGFEVKGLYHYNSDRNGELVCNIPILSSMEDALKKDIKGINFGVTIGDNDKRHALAYKIRELGGLTPNLVHPLAKLSPSATYGTGCFFHSQSFVWTKVKIGSDCILSPNSFLTHHSKIDDGCFITSFSVVGAYSVVGAMTLLGINSVLLPSLTLGKRCFVGAKANVTRSFDDDSVIVGNPARRMDS